MVNFKTVLKDGIDPQNVSWSFTIKSLPRASRTNKQGLLKFVSVVSNANKQQICLELKKSETCRAISSDPLDKFIHISFSDFRLRYPSQNDPLVTEQATAKESGEYIVRFLQAGIVINGVHYRFYGHSNSQLKSRSCYLFAGSKEEISRKVANLGDFSKLKSVAKKVKRIGLLFSTTCGGITLREEQYEDIADIQNKDYNFTDGCGLISANMVKKLAKQHNITFRDARYTPSVLQIRYRGYKGVLTLEPSLHGRVQVQFRDSMRKFRDAGDLTLCVVDYSKPYAYGALNDEIIVLLNALGIDSETLLSKQTEYLDFLFSAEALDAEYGFQFLCFRDRLDLAESLLIHGVESVASETRRLVREEYDKMLNKRGEQRCRIILPKSRLLFGVCDPRGLLREGECFVRVTMDGDGQPGPLTNSEVLVTRNPCMHPGDLQKFKLVQHPELSHLVDCIVFPTRGKRPSADLMSGGDLDGDKFFVCWDPDLIPSTVSEAAEYPGGKEPVTFDDITYDDRIKYFAQYTSASLGQVKNLYLDWVKLKGAMSPECQQLNRLFSQCVDGNRIKIPDKLKDPQPTGQMDSAFILDVLHDAATTAIEARSLESGCYEDYSFDAVQLLLSRVQHAISEFEVIKLVFHWCRKNCRDFSEFMMFFDFELLSDEEKAWTLEQIPPVKGIPSLVFNGLFQSSILTSVDLRSFGLDHPNLRWRCVFDSTSDRMGAFLDNASRTLELFHKKLIILHLDERLALAIYIPAKIQRHSECQVDSAVRVFSFPQTSGTETTRRRVVPTKINYRLFCDGSIFQLYEKKRQNTWIYLTHGPTDRKKYRNTKSSGDRRRQKQAMAESGAIFECRASVALDKISRDIQRQVGRVNRQGILAAEIYVISNRDVSALKTNDLWLQYVDTQEKMSQFAYDNPTAYSIPTLQDVDWSLEPNCVVEVAKNGNLGCLDDIGTADDIDYLLRWLLERDERIKIRTVYDYLSSGKEVQNNCLSDLTVMGRLTHFLVEAPFLASRLFASTCWVTYENALKEDLLTKGPAILRNLLLSANTLSDFVLEPLRDIISRLRYLNLQDFAEILEIIALTVRTPDLALDIVQQVQNETSRVLVGRPRAIESFAQQLYGIALEHIDEAANSRAPRKELLKLVYKEDRNGFAIVECDFRIDAPPSAALKMGDHIRLTAASPPDNAPMRKLAIIDGIVETTQLGTITFRCLQQPPSHMESCPWKLENCGSFVSSKTMIDALVKLHTDRQKCCRVYSAIYGGATSNSDAQLQFHRDGELNGSQNDAIAAAMSSRLCLLWGPPGTGKTRTIAAILQQLLEAEPKKRVLVAAPTHNAVDNILRKFIETYGSAKLGVTPIRVSTDVRKVSDDLKTYTCDAMMKQDLNSNIRSRHEAQKRIKACRLVFTTCIGANLGLLRDEDFQIVLIDEASQQTEATSLVPLVKGCERAVLVGDHVQLSATVEAHAKAFDFDISLFERLYTDERVKGVSKVMLDTQYRMHRELCAFSSECFYDAALKTGVTDDARPLPLSQFPWPQATNDSDGGVVCRKVFVQCSAPEDLGRKSKSNKEQANLCQKICKLLVTEASSSSTDRSQESNQETPTRNKLQQPSIAVLTPYTHQIGLMRGILPGVEVASIDGFQGREADIVVFVTVRCNQRREIGFLKDLRRLNVAMTRAKKGLIIIGDEGTLCGGDDESVGYWRKLVRGCKSVDIDTGVGDERNVQSHYQ